MKYKLEVIPALEANPSKDIELYFNTSNDMLIAKDSMAAMLLFLQDDLEVMDDYSNSFMMFELDPVSGEWDEFDEDDEGEYRLEIEPFYYDTLEEMDKDKCYLEEMYNFLTDELCKMRDKKLVIDRYYQNELVTTEPDENIAINLFD